MGNKRPALLLHVEKEIFSSLFRLATQNLDLVKEMRDCIGRMPWDDLNALNESESSWFKPVIGGCSPTTPSLSAPNTQKTPPAAWEKSQATENVASPAARLEESTSSRSACPDSEAGLPRGTPLDRENNNMNSTHPGPTGSREVSQPRDISPDHENMDVDSPEKNRPPSQQQDPPLGIETQDQIRILRPRSQAFKDYNSLGKRKDAPTVYIRSLKKGKGSKAHHQAPSIGSSLNEPIDVDKLFVSIKARPSFHLTINTGRRIAYP